MVVPDPLKSLQTVVTVCLAVLTAIADAHSAVSKTLLHSSGTPKSLPPKLIWDEDHRRNPLKIDAPLEATVALVRRTKVRLALDHLVLDSEVLAEKRDFCESVKFLEEPVPASCTGVLVAQDIIATAGHCARGERVDDFLYIFGFNTAERANGTLLNIPYTDVYEGKEEVASEYRNSDTEDNRKADWSLIRLWRPVAGRQPVVTRMEGRFASDHLYVIGHPQGLPAKTTKRTEETGLDATTMMLNNEPNAWFDARLDTYGGNSGSPVFNAETGVLEGIVVRGDSDWVKDTEADCVRQSQCPADIGVYGVDRGTIDCDGESVVRATEFAGVLDRELRRSHTPANVVSHQLGALGGDAQFPLPVPDYSRDQLPVNITFENLPTLSGTIISVAVDVTVEHEYSKCELSAWLRGPSGDRIALGQLCNAPFSVDGDTFFFSQHSPSSSSSSSDASARYTMEVKDTVTYDSGKVLSASLSFIVSPVSSVATQTTIQTLELKSPLHGLLQEYSPGIGPARVLLFSLPGEESAGEAESEPETTAPSSSPSSSPRKMVTDWKLDLVLRTPSAASGSAYPLGIELHSPGSGGGRRYRFRVSEVVQDGKVHVSLGGGGNERHRLFFYGVEPSGGDWSVSVFNYSDGPAGWVEEVSMSLMVGLVVPN
uniref:Serine protease n=1 Tax=Chromera velia CCMP2878 TaxID=1169474 RepID=A0A0G4I3P4_9ALVE|eukprot:Cvel_10721.t1-p1 / transcript=Cvel_10721.t1 / gene=Cvel_10721 / organism=Chromera_velia_CCMP2878 / gene_product=hypothetical protein / transcript_product=hypothetical protein / location=Cvel_scaffold652:63482-66538(+) / protein_length=654 / sequence_SO=supercontig / SO=protein_coding / is_pseudo=false